MLLFLKNLSTPQSFQIFWRKDWRIKITIGWSLMMLNIVWETNYCMDSRQKKIKSWIIWWWWWRSKMIPGNNVMGINDWFTIPNWLINLCIYISVDIANIYHHKLLPCWGYMKHRWLGNNLIFVKSDAIFLPFFFSLLLLSP